MARTHRYEPTVRWTGDRGSGTSGYRAYARDHEVLGAGKPPIPGSSDPAFRGDPERWNPEELLVAALAQCHMLWFLHLAATARRGRDRLPGHTDRDHDRAPGRLRRVHRGAAATGGAVRAAEMVERVEPLHEQAHRMCFLARSVSFPVRHEPRTARGLTGAQSMAVAPDALRATSREPSLSASGSACTLRNVAPSTSDR